MDPGARWPGDRALTPSNHPLAGVHVLVTDDEEPVRHMFALILEMAGARVTACSSVSRLGFVLTLSPSQIQGP